MSQPFNCQTSVPSLRPIDEEKGEFWVSSPWLFSASGQNLSAHERNGVFLNDGRGGFHNVSYLSGADSDGDGRSVAAWDITNDGMPELFVRQAGGGSLLVYRNDFPKANWLNVSLRGKKSNSFGIGAKITCEVGGRRVRRELYPIVNFMSQAPAAVHFGLADAESVDRLIIQWPSGEEQTVANIPANQAVVIREGEELAR